jgi:hypothetical protein
MGFRDDMDGLRGLESELISGRPQPEFEFLCEVEAMLREPAPAVRRARQGPRVALAGVLTVALATGLAATGGLSYAASSIRSAAAVVHRASKPNQAIVVRGLSAGGDQYQAGFGFGDPDHNHEGAPGITVADVEGASAGSPAPAAPTRDSLAKLVGTSITFDEQVHLYISVIDSKSRPLLLTQSSKRGGSKVGNGLDGPQTKFIQYAVLVPRTIPIQLRVPSNLLKPNTAYKIRIVAIDPQGNRSQVLVPFRG